MGWKECQIQREMESSGARFEWPGMANFDCAEGTSASDAAGLFGWLWHYPGDYVLSHPMVRAVTGMKDDVIVGHGFSLVFMLAILLGLAMLASWMLR